MQRTCSVSEVLNAIGNTWFVDVAEVLVFNSNSYQIKVNIVKCFDQTESLVEDEWVATQCLLHRESFISKEFTSRSVRKTKVHQGTFDNLHKMMQ